MNRLRRFSSLVSPVVLAGACAQLIGLSDYETGNEKAAKGGEGGEGDATSGGTRATGGNAANGTGGAGVKTGGTGGDAGEGAGGEVVATGGTRPSRGGAGGASGAGDAGEPGQGGTNSTGGKAMGGASTGGASTGGAKTGGTDAGGTDTGGTDTGGTDTGGTSTGGTGGGPPTCTEITLDGLALGDFSDTSNPALGYYVLDLRPAFGTSVLDRFEIEFWDGGPYNGADPGTFQVGAGTGRDSNYVSCARCLLVYVDKSAAGEKRFFQRSGSITIQPTSEHMTARPNVTITNLTLEEVTWDDDTLISEPVVGGECLHLASATVFVPPAWTCDPVWYDDSDCDCGCEAPDPVCADSTPASCDYCWCDDTSGNCSMREVQATMNQFCR